MVGVSAKQIVLYKSISLQSKFDIFKAIGIYSGIFHIDAQDTSQEISILVHLYPYELVFNPKI